MKAIIIRSEKLTFWYADKAGEVFDVKEYDGRSYQVIGDKNWHGLIRIADCKILPPNEVAIDYIKVDGLSEILMN